MIELVSDSRKIRDFMIQDEMWWYCSEEGVNPYSWEPIINTYHMWLMYGDIAIIYIEQQNTTSVKIHLYIKKEYREEKGIEIAKTFYEWWLGQEYTINKFNLSIPANNKKLSDFVESIGFTKEGVDRQSYRKCGGIIDQDYYGQTIGEVKKWVA